MRMPPLRAPGPSKVSRSGVESRQPHTPHPAEGLPKRQLPRQAARARPCSGSYQLLFSRRVTPHLLLDLPLRPFLCRLAPQVTARSAVIQGTSPQVLTPAANPGPRPLLCAMSGVSQQPELGPGVVLPVKYPLP